MINLGQLGQSLEQGPVVIRALNSLTRQQADTITQAMGACAPGWETDLLDDYDGYLSVLISRPNEGLEDRAYLVSGTAKQIELSEVRDDKLILLGHFSDLQTVVSALLGAL